MMCNQKYEVRNKLIILPLQVFHLAQYIKDIKKILLLMIISAIYCIFFDLACYTNLLITKSYAGQCYLEGDLGKGATIEVESNPSNMMMKRTPQGRQIVKWIDTGLFAVGQVSKGDGSISVVPITGHISGAWYPWGYTAGTPLACQVQACKTNMNIGGVNVVDTDCLNSDTADGLSAGDEGKLVPTVSSNIGCSLKNGMGLYGLIALPKEGSYNNQYNSPNDNAAVSSNPPAEFFRTFHIGHISDGNGNFTVSASTKCKVNNGNGKAYSCSSDTSNGSDNLLGGRLYLKIIDSYYEDNSGSYTVSFDNGIYRPGFIQQAIEVFENQLNLISKKLFIEVMKPMAEIATLLIILYMIMNGITFMMGISGKNQTEMLMFILKLAFVGSLLGNANNFYQFMNDHFFALFTSIANTFSDIIVNAALLTESPNPNLSGETIHLEGSNSLTGGGLPIGASYMTMYDGMLNSMISTAVNMKLISLLFTSKFYFIPLLYILIFIVIVAILKALTMYVMAIMQTALLIVIFPMILVFLLFKTTAEFFKNWISGMTNSAMLVIVTTAAVALMFQLIDDAFAHLFAYKSCYQVLWEPQIFGFTLFTFKFWAPAIDGQIDNSLTAYNYLYTLIIAVMFNMIVDNAAKLSDSLSSASLLPSSSTYSDMVGSAQESLNSIKGATIDKVADKITELNVKHGLGKVVGDRVDTGKDQDGKMNTGGKVVRKLHKYYDKAEKKYNDITKTTRGGGG